MHQFEQLLVLFGAALFLAAFARIGDDAFHLIEEELDWLEMADGRRDESPH